MADTGFGVSLRMFKEAFFDREAVTNSIDKKSKSVLSKMGAYIRQRARTSIRSSRGKKRKTASPGSPPIGHLDKLRKSILFMWDAANRSVIVGPFLFDDGVSGPTVPQLLESGGRSAETGKMYPAFPFMGPARDKELPKLPQLWRAAA